MQSRSPEVGAKLGSHPLLERQWSLDEFTLLKVFFALLGCALSFVAMVFFGGYALIVGPAVAMLLLVGGVMVGLAKTDRHLTLALRVMIVAAVIGSGPGLYLGLWFVA